MGQLSVAHVILSGGAAVARDRTSLDSANTAGWEHQKYRERESSAEILIVRGSPAIPSSRVNKGKAVETPLNGLDFMERS